MKKDFITLEDYTSQEILDLLDLATQLKQDRSIGSIALTGKSVGLVFQKPSNRTRVSFEVGVYQLGGNCIYLGPKEIKLGSRESTPDVAQTLSRYLDCIVARTFDHEDIQSLANNASVPIINALSDKYHPCQALADILLIKEKFGDFEGLKFSYIGDGNNMCHSLMYACAKVGIDVHVATPQGYEPADDVVAKTKEYASEHGSNVLMTSDPKEAVENVQIVYSDVWVSMGQEEETNSKLKDFEGFQINKELVSHAADNFIFMHCLPAHRDLEVTADVIDDEKHSIIFDQAENRLHAQKAILMKLLN